MIRKGRKPIRYDQKEEVGEEGYIVLTNRERKGHEAHTKKEVFGRRQRRKRERNQDEFMRLTGIENKGDRRDGNEE